MSDPSTPPAFVVLCTVPEAQADQMVDRLLEERLVACVNFLGPVRSRYRWQGALEEAHEMLLLLKTSPAARERLRQRIVELHPYEVPEVLELGVDSGLPAYLAWVTECCDG